MDSKDYPLRLSTAVYRVFRGVGGAVGLLAQFQYETDAQKWCELLPFDRDYPHVLVPREGVPKVYGLTDRNAALAQMGGTYGLGPTFGVVGQ